MKLLKLNFHSIEDFKQVLRFRVDHFLRLDFFGGDDG